MSTVDEKKSEIFSELSADEVPEVTEVESLCMNCHANGITKLLLTRIPHFRDVIVSSFACEECGYENRQLDSAGSIGKKGVRFSLTVKNKSDLNRQIVLSSGSEIQLPHLESSFPSSKGTITTIEGAIRSFAENLKEMQPVRRATDPTVADKIDEFISNLENLLLLDREFVLILDDPSSRSWLSSPFAPHIDPQLDVRYYIRTAEQDEKLGVNQQAVSATEEDTFNPKDEVVTFQVNCPQCNAPAESNMKMVDIPFFKEVVIMATVCDHCGHRDNEVKGGSGIEPLGRRMELLLTDKSDLNRDVLKSETCSVEIPELDMQTMSGTLGGRFTTVEGLLVAIRDQLQSSIAGDSTEPTQQQSMEQWLAKLQEVIDGSRLQVHIILDDPAGNSYLQNLYAPDPDPHMTVREYERNFEQRDELGLNDMCTENYE